MTDNAIPPCGPERDRLVAEAVGWNTRLTIRGEEPRAFEDGHGFRYPSSDDADALAALEAWRAAPGTRRSYMLGAPDTSTPDFWVGLEPGDGYPSARAPTLADAATAALVRWRNERSGT